LLPVNGTYPNPGGVPFFCYIIINDRNVVIDLDLCDKGVQEPGDKVAVMHVPASEAVQPSLDGFPPQDGLF